MRFTKSIPNIGLLLYMLVAAVVVTSAFVFDSMGWFFAMQAIAFPTKLAFEFLPIPTDLPRSVDRGLFVLAIVINGALLYVGLWVIAKLAKAVRGKHG